MLRNVLLLLVLTCTSVHCRDLGQWKNNDPAISEWYRNLKQPDAPEASCCGEADAYWCDDYYSKLDSEGKSHAYCKITDDREDAPRSRPHIDIGTEIEIPPHKLKWDKSNPTGHAIVFLGGGILAHYVFCFVQNGGV